jgi:hypothetical protein
VVPAAAQNAVVAVEGVGSGSVVPAAVAAQNAVVFVEGVGSGSTENFILLFDSDFDDKEEESYKAVLRMAAEHLDHPMEPILNVIDIPKRLTKKMYCMLLIGAEWELVQLYGTIGEQCRYCLYTSNEYGTSHLVPECYGKFNATPGVIKDTRWMLLRATKK